MSQRSILIAHHDPSVRGELASALPSRHVVEAEDGFAATSEAASRRFGDIVIAHPLGDMDALMLSSWLRASGATGRILVLAEGASDVECEDLRSVLDDGCTLLRSRGEVASALGTTIEVGSPVEELAEEPAPVEQSLSPEDAAFLRKYGDRSVALRTDPLARNRWCMFRLPDQVQEALDGRATVEQFVTESPSGAPGAVDILRRLMEVDCLTLEAAVVPEGESPVTLLPDAGEPSRSPDEGRALASTEIFDFLLGLRRRQLTGKLAIEGPDWVVTLSVRDGRIQDAAGGPPETELGPVLVRMGCLSMEDLDKFMYESASNPQARLETIALRLGWVNAAYVHAGLSRSVEAKLEALLPLSRAQVRTYLGDADGAARPLELRPVETLVAEWLRAHDERRAELVARFRSEMGAERLDPSPAAMELLPLLHLGARGQRLLKALSGKTVQAVLEDTPLPADEAPLGLYLLWAAGGLTRSEPERARPVASSPVSPPAAVVAAVPVAPEAPLLPESLEELLSRGERHLSQREFEQALSALSEARRLAPRDSRIMLAYGTAVFRSQPGSEEHRNRARQLLETALEADAGLTGALVVLGKICRLEGDFLGAKARFRRALALDADCGAAESELRSLEKLEKRLSVDDSNPQPEDPGETGSMRNLFSRFRRR